MIMARLTSTTALAPAPWIYEVAAGLRAAERRERIDPVDAERALALLESLPIEHHQPRATALLRLSRALEISTYDASYLAVALDHAVPVATLDQRMRTAAITLGVPLAA
jgi:predicted nucleic acid-binding protein